MKTIVQSVLVGTHKWLGADSNSGDSKALSQTPSPSSISSAFFLFLSSLPGILKLCPSIHRHKSLLETIKYTWFKGSRARLSLLSRGIKYHLSFFLRIFRHIALLLLFFCLIYPFSFYSADSESATEEGTQCPNGYALDLTQDFREVRAFTKGKQAYIQCENFDQFWALWDSGPSGRNQAMKLTVKIKK